MLTTENSTLTQEKRTEELVPSRYALRVGEIDGRVFSDGVFDAAGRVNGHQRRPGPSGGVVGQHVPVARRVRLGAERGRRA